MIQGGGCQGAEGYFIEPTLIQTDNPGYRLLCEEIFGPVLSVIRFRTVDEAFEINNDVRYGLSSSVYTRDVNVAMRALNELDNGITYINAPTLLNGTVQMKMKTHPNVIFAGQICGVEGYVESIATGLLAGQVAAGMVSNTEIAPPPRESAFGSLTHDLTHAEAKNFQPANITFDLLPALEQRVRD